MLLFILGVIVCSALSSVYYDRGFAAAILLWTLPSVLLFMVCILLNLQLVKDPNGVVIDSFGASNALTSLRIISVAPMLVSLFYGRILIGLILYVLAAVTDVADGYIARKYSQQTLIGVMLDPVGDILSTEAVCFFLWVRGQVPFWLFLLLTLRYIHFFGGLAILSYLGRKPELKATIAGKVVGVIQFIGFFSLLLYMMSPGNDMNAYIKGIIFALLALSFSAVIVSQTMIGVKALKNKY